MKLNPFLRGYLNSNEYVYPMISYIPNGFINLGSWETDCKTGGQQLIKTEKNLYIFIQNTSRLYKAVHVDSAKIDFVRIDSTASMNYNIGSFQFSVGEDIYSYGGYGFWKNNGLLRKFNFKHNEWDILPVNQEVFLEVLPIQMVWYNAKHKKMIVPLQQIRNDGITHLNHKFGHIEESSWEFDMVTQQWMKKGKASETVLKFAEDAANRFCYSSNEGVLYVSYGLMYWFDYHTNNLYKSAALEVIQDIDRNEKSQVFTYLRSKKIYYWNPQKNISDTISLANIRFENVDSIIINEQNTLYKIVVGLLFVIVLFFVSLGIRKRIKSNSKSYPGKNDFLIDEPEVIDRNQNVSDSNLVFNTTEIELIKMFLEISTTTGLADIEQINHVLGIKNKNKGMQKKVRSDVINSVNEKYKIAFHTDTLLIESIRKKEDKRFFDYYIGEVNRLLIEKYIL